MEEGDPGRRTSKAWGVRQQDSAETGLSMAATGYTGGKKGEE